MSIRETFISQCAPRIAEERLRLGLSQQAIATLCGVSREVWGKYERGIAIPGGDVLLAIARTDADTLYILTGVRVTEVLRRGEEVGEEAVVLKPDEAALVDNYRHSPESAKRNLQAVGVAFAQQRVAKRSPGNREHAAAVSA